MVEFSFSTIQNFDEHILKSIRGYEHLINDVVSLSQYFIQSKSTVIDVGCSTGKMLNTIQHCNNNINDVTYIGIEKEQNLIEQHTGIEMCNCDVLEFDNWIGSSFVTSIFTLQFINKAFRKQIVSNIYNGLLPGGSFVFAEKIYSDNSQLQDMMTFMYYDYKRQSFAADEILDKENSLRHLLRPVTEQELLDVIVSCGFRTVEPFWRNFNFVGYVAIK